MEQKLLAERRDGDPSEPPLIPFLNSIMGIRDGTRSLAVETGRHYIHNPLRSRFFGGMGLMQNMPKIVLGLPKIPFLPKNVAQNWDISCLVRLVQKCQKDA